MGNARITDLAMIAVSETYLDVEKLIFHTVHRFVKAYGGDFDEYRSDANLAYMDAYQTYHRSKGTFEAWVRFKVWKRLLEVLRTKIGRNNRLPRVEADLEAMPVHAEPNPFWLSDFLAELSDDARAVVELILDSPQSIEQSIRKRGGDTPHNIKAAVKEFLKDVGWAAGQVTDSFLEIGRIIR